MLATLPSGEDQIVELVDSCETGVISLGQIQEKLANPEKTEGEEKTNYKLRIAFIGAGGVNFGGIDPGAPWDHASRLEELCKTIPLEVVGISDPNPTRLDFVIKERQAKELPLWANTQTFTDTSTMLDITKPTAVFIGLPPFAHGAVEEMCAARDIHMFVEKPLSSREPAFVEQLRDCFSSHPGLIVSVGYMLRYHKAIDFIKCFLKDKNITPTSICARYNSAYTSMPKPSFWDARTSGGPVVEQGTHFCDLARYLGGDIDLDSVSSVAVRASSPVGSLQGVPPGCDVGLPEEHRIARATSSIFQFENGAVGILQHALLMRGEKYFTEFEIWCQGYKICLVDPYTNDCHIVIHDSATCHKAVYPFPDDPYLTEDRAFLEAILDGDCSKIRSLYGDAVETYKLSYRIQNGA
jgi:predicted dehydrogenase